MDYIEIKGLRYDTILGVYPEERLKPRPVVVDVVLGVDLSKASATDDIADTVDYHELSRKIVSETGFAEGREENPSYFLVERLAGDIMSVAFGFDDRIESVTVSAAKPDPCDILDCATVRISKSRGNILH